MLHNKYACDNPISVTVSGSVYIFTYLDCRQSSKQVIQSILQVFACDYLSRLGIILDSNPSCSSKTTFTYTGNTLTVLLPLSIGALLYNSQELIYNGASLTYVESN